MKKIKLLTVFFLLSFSTFSQINPFLGIYDVDSCKFESQCSLLQIDTSLQNIWQIGKPAKPFFDTAYSSLNALITDTINPYPISNHSYFDLIIPTNYYYLANLIVGFKHKFQTDTLTDGGYIEVSYDIGITWNNVLHDDIVHNVMEFHTENLYSEQDTLRGGINGFSGTSNGWIYTRIQWVWILPIKTVPLDTLIMRFHFISDSIQTNKDGWMIDNILISFVDLPSSIKEIENNHSRIYIMPNPVDNFATIKFDNFKNEIFKLTIYNPFGQIIKQIENIKTNQIEIYKNDLTSGLYFIQLRNSYSILGTSKLIIK
ncbi:MAG: T9SS type A sorting domain-containing protein [Bacteroidales bacterium]